MKPNFWGRIDILVILRMATTDSWVVQEPKSRVFGLKVSSEGVTYARTRNCTGCDYKGRSFNSKTVLSSHGLDSLLG